MKIQRVLWFTIGLELIVNFGFAQQRSIEKPVPAPAATNTPRAQNFSTNADLQARARELLRQEVARGKPASAPPAVPSPAARSGKPPAATPPPKPVPVEPLMRVPAAAELTNAEAKLQELLQRKEAREKAARDAESVQAEPRTKRDKLDQLLKLYLTGKISQAEYDQQRGKLIAQPD